MRVLLASPESKVWNSRQHIHNGLGYLAGALRHAGYDVSLYDASIETEPLADVLQRERYDVVGISSPTPLIREAWQAATMAKSTGAVTILGGPHLTLKPAESMEHDEVDLVLRGEGEDALVEIMQMLEGEGSARPPAQEPGQESGQVNKEQEQ